MVTDKMCNFGVLIRMYTNQRLMNGIYGKSVKQRIERFLEKVYDCILIFTNWLG